MSVKDLEFTNKNLLKIFHLYIEECLVITLIIKFSNFNLICRSLWISNLQINLRVLDYQILQPINC